MKDGVTKDIAIVREQDDPATHGKYGSYHRQKQPDPRLLDPRIEHRQPIYQRMVVDPHVSPFITPFE